MRINKLILATATNDSDILKFAFRDTRIIEEYIVKDITGLDASDVISNFSGFGANSVPFYDMALSDRLIAMKLGLNPTFRNSRTYSDLRDELYRLIAKDRTGKLKLYCAFDDTKLAVVKGSITKVETNHFTLSPEVQVVMKCESPVFRGPTLNSVDVDLFGREFFLTDCASTAPHGMELDIKIHEATDNVIFKSAETVFSIKRTVDGGLPGFPVDSILKLSSELDNRYAKLSVTGVPGDILITEGVEGFRGSQWPMIYPGRNKYELISNGSIVGLRYREAFWGI